MIERRQKQCERRGRAESRTQHGGGYTVPFLPFLFPHLHPLFSSCEGSSSHLTVPPRSPVRLAVSSYVLSEWMHTSVCGSKCVGERDFFFFTGKPSSLVSASRFYYFLSCVCVSGLMMLLRLIFGYFVGSLEFFLPGGKRRGLIWTDSYANTLKKKAKTVAHCES